MPIWEFSGHPWTQKFDLNIKHTAIINKAQVELTFLVAYIKKPPQKTCDPKHLEATNQGLHVIYYMFLSSHSKVIYTSSTSGTLIL